jgi:hypothetical protein
MRPYLASLVVIVACSSSSSARNGSSEGAAALGNADCDAGYASVSFDADGGATTSGYDPSCVDAGPRGSFDHGILGKDCSSTARCPSTQDCWDYRSLDPSLTSAKCIDRSVEPCSVVTCPPGKRCFQLASFPGQVACMY